MSDALRNSAEPTVLGALALELSAGGPVARDTLAQGQAGRLAGHIAADLARFDADAAASSRSWRRGHRATWWRGMAAG